MFLASVIVDFSLDLFNIGIFVEAGVLSFNRDKDIVKDLDLFELIPVFQLAKKLSKLIVAQQISFEFEDLVYNLLLENAFGSVNKHKFQFSWLIFWKTKVENHLLLLSWKVIVGCSQNLYFLILAQFDKIGVVCPFLNVAVFKADVFDDSTSVWTIFSFILVPYYHLIGQTSILFKKILQYFFLFDIKEPR